ncbi:MAG: diguanylate cyclase [Thermodesulfobacteriota bacterium]|nr:diguanylate cyclase [Thermodesulfobacteriota bacterium]
MKAIICSRQRPGENILSALEGQFEDIHVINTDRDAISAIYMDPPDLILIEKALSLETNNGVIRELKGSSIYAHLPLVLILNKDDMDKIQWDTLLADDFIFVSDNAALIRARIAFIIARTCRKMDTNPLTKLPGNESIMRVIQKMFDERRQIAIAWVDLDSFKPFNDFYGFSRGDEILLATARIITNAVKEIGEDTGFVGHIGGDDFVFICPLRLVRRLCEEIIMRFDMVVRNFYNDEDLKEGHIISKDRSGNSSPFDIMTLSIAVVENINGQYRHYGEVSRDATEIKKYVKTLKGSNFMINRRKDKEE